MRGLRFDLALQARGLASSRTRASALIKNGDVAVNGTICRKPAQIIYESDALALQNPIAYVGRGYLKLERALASFAINVAGLRCMDIGASTGGFTQLLLEHGAALVYAVDVGAGQLAQLLRDDPRVVNLEHTDIRALPRNAVEAISFASVDVSFISLRLILPKLYELINENASAVCLIKPQFEVGPGVVSKKGVVKDHAAQARAIDNTLQSARTLGFAACGLAPSPIAGGEGNLEFLLYLRKSAAQGPLPSAREVVEAAWMELK